MVLRAPFRLSKIAFALCAAAAIASCAQPEAPGPLRLSQISFADLEGWPGENLPAAFAAFIRSCERHAELADDAPLGGAGYAGNAASWRGPCDGAQALAGAGNVRRFFETEFVPYRVSAADVESGLFTGYYEPLLSGSRARGGVYQTPLYGLPADLVSVDLGLFRENLAGQRLAGRIEAGRLVPYASRAEIVRDGLPEAEALLFVDDPVDAFFLQIQGSGRVALDDGTMVRAAYAGQNGHPYTAIGAVLVSMGALEREAVSMQSIRAWLAANPEGAARLLQANASYVFFNVETLGDPGLGARGTQGVPLTPEASLAIDATAHPLGIPVWLETSIPAADDGETLFDRLLVTQDTGGAIRGAVRGDIYWGFGDAAGEIAGRMRSTGRMSVLLPRAIAARLGEAAEFPAPLP